MDGEKIKLDWATLISIKHRDKRHQAYPTVTILIEAEISRKHVF